MTTYHVVGAAWSERQRGELVLEQFTHELRFLVVECDARVAAVGTLARTLVQLLVVPLSHVALGESRPHLV